MVKGYKINKLSLKQLSVLFVEDDEIILEGISLYLEKLFSRVIVATSMQEAFTAYYENRVDVLFSDVVLPDGSGLDFISEIRKKDSTLTAVIYSAYGDEANLLKAANSGVDGYVLKPGSRKEIEETIIKAIKQRGRLDIRIALTKDISYHPLQKTIFKKESKVDVGQKELQLLELLLDNANKLVTKEQIYESIWPLESVTESAIKNLLSRLRGKLEGVSILSARGKGWILELEGASS